MNSEKRKSILDSFIDVYWFVKKRSRLFFWFTLIILIAVFGILIYLQTSSLENIWIAFIVGPVIMFFVYISNKIVRWEDKHNLTHHKSDNGVYIHTTLPLRKYPKKKK